MKYHKWIFFAFIILFICISIFLPCLSNAAIVANTGSGNWPIIPSGQIITRYGDNAIGGTWELSNGASDFKDYVWSNGVDIPFTLRHSGSGLTLTLSGGTSTTWSYSAGPFRVRDIYITVWSQNASDTITIDNLVFNGTSISSSLVGQSSRGFMHIYDDSHDFDGFSTFTLTGTINLAWVAPPPPQLQARFTVINFYATGANTYMIAVLAILAISTGIFVIKRYRYNQSKRI